MNGSRDHAEAAAKLQRVYDATAIPESHSHRLERFMPRADWSHTRRWVVPAATALALAGVALGSAGFFVNESDGPNVVPASGSISQPSPSDSSTSVMTSEMWRRQNALSDAQTLINQVASSDASYDTTVSDLATNTLIIYRAAEDPADFGRAYRSVVPQTISLRFASALLNRAQQADLSQIVEDHRERFRRKGVLITLAMEEKPGGRYLIGYDPAAATPDPADLTTFEKYGIGSVAFSPIQPAILLNGSAG